MRTPLLARLGVGAKLLLLALLPVGVLLVFTIGGAVDDWHQASARSDFRDATRQSFADARLATALADERAAATLARLEPETTTAADGRRARAAADTALGQAIAAAQSWHGGLDLRGRLDATRRQLNAARVQVASGSLTVRQSADAYSAIISGVLDTMQELDSTALTRPSARAADAYVAMATATEAASRERLDVAALIASHAAPTLPAVRGRTLEQSELQAFRDNASGPLAADLEAALYSTAGLAVTAMRDALDRSPRQALTQIPLARWLRATGTRITALRTLQDASLANVRSAASADVGAARSRAFRNFGLSIAVILLVTALALALRRSITEPLGEVARGARRLSGGDLALDVRYHGRDEIGDVAASFRSLHETVGRLAGEIREMSAAVRDNRLDHRADIAAFEGTWAQLLSGVNDTMSAFGELEGQRERAERELGDFFELSVDLLCIANFDAHFTRVNPAAVRTLGYSEAELLSRPFFEFVHPDDHERLTAVLDTLRSGGDVVQLENRVVRPDGTVRWIQWSTRALEDEQLVYAVGRDVTERRRGEAEQQALHRVAKLVAEGAPPRTVFSAVAAEIGRLVDADVALVLRYEPERTVTVVGGWSVPEIQVPVGSRFDVAGRGVSVRVLELRRPARVVGFEGPPGSIPAFFHDLGGRSGAGAPITVGGRLWGVLVTASRREDAFPPGSERAVAEFTDLVATAIANAESQEALTASRARVVAASDEARRRIERDLHDGAQQQLVSLALQLRAAQATVPAKQAELALQLERVAEGLTSALDELREFARGIHPAVLAQGGLGPALRSLARRSELPLELDVRLDGRLAEPVEVAAYYVVSEALTNAAKHANATAVEVEVEADDGRLRISVCDDGVGGAGLGAGSGLVGLKDRVEALGGRMTIESPAGAGTTVAVELPLRPSR